MAHGCTGTGTRPPRVVESMRPGHSAAPLWLPDPVCAVCGGETMQEAGKTRKNSETVTRKLLYEFGPFRVDPQRRLLLQDGQPVPLTGKAFDILLALLECHGEIRSEEHTSELQSLRHLVCR